MRTANVERKTTETEISLKLDLDGSGQRSIDTGIGFLDHMLGHMAFHGIFDLELKARGDLYVDMHHTIEDCALALGQAFDQALGDRSDIVRMGSFYVPMDESLAFVCVDLSGRPYTIVQAEWSGCEISGIPTSLFPHFLESFAITCRANLHAQVLYGRDDHHKAEAIFKALGRSLQAATRIDPRRVTGIPSTKGAL